MQKMTMPKMKRGNMVFLSETCEHVTKGRAGKKVVKHYQLINDGKETFCPKCRLDAATQEVVTQQSELAEENEKKRAYEAFFTQSVLTDETLLNARLDNFEIDNEEQRQNLAETKKLVEQIKKGEVFNIFTQGKRGAGKSHLMYALAYELNEHYKGQKKKVLFVEVAEMLDKIRDSFRNKQSRYTEQYFKELLSEADIVVFDDLGSETGAIDTEKAATDFTVKMLKSITTARQDKVTATTSNLSGKQLFETYDERVISRLLRNPRYIVFKVTNDKRLERLPF